MKRKVDAYWIALRGRVRRRSGGLCEFCQLRPLSDLHHRHYRTEGAEKMEDVMAVCRTCHKVIHRRRVKKLPVAPGSLAAMGDSGLDYYGTNRAWLVYLASRARPAAAAGRPKPASRQR